MMRLIKNLFLSILCLSFIFGCIPASATVRDCEPLKKIGNVFPNVSKSVGASISYRNNGNDSYISYPDFMSEDNLKSLAEIFSDSNLEYKSSEETQPVSDDKRPKEGVFSFSDTDDVKWCFRFDNENVLVWKIVTADITNIKFSQGWFKFKTPEVHQKLISLIEMLIENKEEKSKAEREKPLKDQVNVSDIEPLYYTQSKIQGMDIFWGICKYTKNGKSIVVPYISDTDPGVLGVDKYFIADGVKNNKFIIDYNKCVIAYDNEKTGREYNSEDEKRTYIFEISVNVTDAGKADKISAKSTYKPTGKTASEVIDMKGKSQTGNLLYGGLFSVKNNINYDNEEGKVLPDQNDKNDKNDKNAENDKNTENDKNAEDKSDNQNQAVNSDEEQKQTDNSLKEDEKLPQSEEDNKYDTQETDNRGYADKLNSIGLFKGTENGYELDKQFTRAEGAAMIVRLLGLENTVLNEKKEEIFNDVPADNWAASYIAYCYRNNIIKGIGDGSYAPDENMSGEQYLTLLLRTLGYSDAEPETAEKLSAEINMLKEDETRDILGSTDFNREKMVYASYKALETKMKNGMLMIDSLIEKNAVSAEAAAEAGLVKK